MVKHNPTWRMIWRTVKGSLGRYFAIVAIIGLGAGFLAGLRVARDAMVKTGDAYYRSYLFSDFVLISSLGLTEKDVNAALQTDGVTAAEGSVSGEFLYEDKHGDVGVLKAYSITEHINQLNLLEGRMPKAANECVLDSKIGGKGDLQTQISLSDENSEETTALFAYEGYTVVGIVDSPYYLNEERGTTSLGNGTIDGFIYLLPEGFDTDYFTEIYVSLSDETPEIYSADYNALVDAVEPALQENLENRGVERYQELYEEAEAQIQDGEQQLSDGRDALEAQRTEGQQKLDDAAAELEDARTALDEGWEEYNSGQSELESSTASAEAELQEGQKKLDDAKAELETSEQEYQKGKEKLSGGEASYEAGLQEYEDGLHSFEAGLKEYQDGLKTYEDGEAAYADGAAQLAAAKDTLNSSKATLDETKDQLDAAEAQYASILAFQQRADEYRASMASAGYSYDSNDAFAASLMAAVNQISSAESQHAQTVYRLSQSILQPFGMTPESLVASADQLTALQKEFILTAVNAGGAGYGVRYADFDSYCADLTSAIALISAQEYQESMRLYEVASGVLGSYTSDYDQSIGIQGFLTDCNYYAAVQSAMASSFGCGTDLLSLRSAMDSAWAQYEDGVQQYEAGLSAYQENEARLAESRALLDSAKQELDAAWETLEPVQTQLNAAKETLDASRKELDDGWAELNTARRALDDGWKEYQSGQQNLSAGESELHRETEAARAKLEEARQELEDGETSYREGLAEYEDGLSQFQTEIADAEEALKESEQSLADAQTELGKLKPATIYVLNRDMNVGYACFQNDAQIVAGISRVFPLFFFLVAALVCITTMTRMVEDDRTQIGTMKALGYGNLTISRKYLIYAGSASLIGCISGLVLGMWLIPLALWQAYSVRYTFGDILFYFDLRLSTVCWCGYISSALGVTWLSCRNELREVPAELIRPKSPKAGKRVLLERIPFLWKRLKFLHKVSVRNVFRYKKRLFMMLVGIGGCTSLLVTGFGIRDSVQDFVNYQYDDISFYDGVVSFENTMNEEDQQAFLEECGAVVTDAVFLHLSSVEFHEDDRILSASLVASDGDLSGFMDFHSGSRTLPYPEEGECLISRGISEQFGYQAGEQITVYDQNLHALHLTVSGVYDNYISNYVYTTIGSLENWDGGNEIKTSYVCYSDEADSYEATAAVASASGVTSVLDTASERSRINTMMSSLNYIVALVVLCAGTLAFIVLYNLTNINISERSREIATIKVLGFYAGETASYVFRENQILAVLGAVVGLPVGKVLHAYVMHQIKVDGMCFDIRIKVISYAVAVILTLLFAWIVNGVMYFKLRGINMTESLKSVE